MNRKDVIRPIYGTVVFQPFALLWCLLSGDDYLTMIDDRSFSIPPSSSYPSIRFTNGSIQTPVRKHH